MDRPDDAALLAEAETRVRIAERQGHHNRSVPVQFLRDLSAALRAALQREQEQCRLWKAVAEAYEARASIAKEIRVRAAEQRPEFRKGAP